MASYIALRFIPFTRAQAQSVEALSNYYQALSQALASPSLFSEIRGYREYYEFPIEGTREERAPITASPSKLAISGRAADLIVFFEVSDSSTYSTMYAKPTLPPGESGITIGIGYDLGYSSPELFNADWRDYVDASILSALADVCGLTSSNAKPKLASVQSIKIPYDIAYLQFSKNELPKYTGITERILPNFAALPPDCRGALVSLVYNRGPSFRQTGDRYAEMREILSLMQVGTPAAFSRIPDQILAMRRLWQDPALNLKGLVTRRELESKLFAAGLGSN